MKKGIVYLLLFVVTFLSVTAQEKNNFKITAKIKDLNATKATYLLENKENSKGIWKHFDVEKDHFTFETKVSEPTIMCLNFDDNALIKYSSPEKRGYFATHVSLLVFIASPDSEIKAEGKVGDFLEAYPSGDKENELLSKLNKKLHPIINERLNIIYKKGDKTLSQNDRDKLMILLDSVDKAADKIQLEFVKENISSIIGLSTCRKLLGHSLSADDAQILFKNIAEKYKTSRYYKELMDRYQEVRDEIIAKEKTKEGVDVPEIITSESYDGKEFDLKSLRGKYVLIDFWGTWCGACVKGMPSMKEFRDKHKDKLQILGIAQESSNTTRWKKFLDSNKYNWPQILSGKGDKNFVKKFGVTAFPTKILVSPDGKILLRYVGEESNFYNELEKLIK